MASAIPVADVNLLMGAMSQINVQQGCVSEMVAHQAAVAPTAIAIRDGSRSLSYGELESQSNQLARFLQSVGIGPEKVVGLHLDRSPEMVVAALSILKTGGAYLPLPPDSPPERLAFML